MTDTDYWEGLASRADREAEALASLLGATELPAAAKALRKLEASTRRRAASYRRTAYPVGDARRRPPTPRQEALALGPLRRVETGGVYRDWDDRDGDDRGGR